MQKKKTGLVAILVLCLLMVGVFAAWRAFSPEAVQGGKTITVNVDHLEGKDTSFTIRTDAEFLRGAMEQEGLVFGTEMDFGLWVETVDGETADSTKEEWWGFDVNGELGQYGVDTQPIADGDVYDFVLNVGY